MPKLGVNIDHVATVREARKTIEPEPVAAAIICELAGAHSIVCHLREDRRHINDRDLKILKGVVQTRLNLEMCIHKQIVDIALEVRPHQATLVPERRREVTTEGGLNLFAGTDKIENAIKRLQGRGVMVSLFIDPDKKQIKAAKELGAKFIELHTGAYANSKNELQTKLRLQDLTSCARLAQELGLGVNAGHGLTYRNVKPVAQIPGIQELNIGHSIVSRAVLVGLDRAVREMLDLIK